MDPVSAIILGESGQAIGPGDAGYHFSSFWFLRREWIVYP